MTIEELNRVVSEGGRPQIAAEYGAHIALRDARINALENRIKELEAALLAAQLPAAPLEFPPLPEHVAVTNEPQGLQATATDGSQAIIGSGG